MDALHHFAQGHFDREPALDADHEPGAAFGQSPNGGFTRAGSDDAVPSSWPASALNVAEDYNAGLALQLLLDCASDAEGTAQFFAFRDDDDVAALAAGYRVAEMCHEAWDLFDAAGHGHSGCTTGKRDVRGDCPTRAAHDFDEEHRARGFARIAEVVDGIDGSIHGGIEADGFVRAEDVVIDGAGDARDPHSVFRFEEEGAAEAAIAADYDEAFDTVRLHLTSDLGAHGGFVEGGASRRADERAAELNDVADGAVVEDARAVLDEAAVTIEVGNDFYPEPTGRANDSPDGRIHAGRIAAACEDTDAFHGYRFGVERIRCKNKSPGVGPLLAGARSFGRSRFS